MRVWDLETGEKKSTIDVGPVDLWTVAFSPDDKYIISGSHSGKITFYSVETAKAERSLDTRGKFILSIAYVSHILCFLNMTFFINIFLKILYFLCCKSKFLQVLRKAFMGRIIILNVIFQYSVSLKEVDHKFLISTQLICFLKQIIFLQQLKIGFYDLCQIWCNSFQ